MKFSVVIPTHQRVKYLAKAIESVANQTYNNFEIIVVNDYPEDKRDIDHLASQFENIRVFHQPFPQGGNAARNLGINESRGDIIAFLDDDDEWFPTKLESHAKTHTKFPEAGLVYSNCLYVHNNPLIQDQATNSALPQNIVTTMANARFCPATSSIVSITREVTEQCGLFDESLVSFQDWDYWFRIAHKFQFAYIPEVLVKFRQHLGDRVSHNERKRLTGILQICSKWDREIDVKQFEKSMKRILYYHLSINALMSGDKTTFLKKSFHLLHKNIVSLKSLSSFTNLWLHVFIKNRKRRLQFKTL